MDDSSAVLPQSLADPASWQLEDYDWDPKSFRAIKKQALGSAKQMSCKANSLSNIKTSTDKNTNAVSSANVHCQADGCSRDMSSLTYYHIRNKICDLHIKADAFLKHGVQMRFCQRCGHPHGLQEFDHKKHSCRAQLEKHNARRRRRQAATLSSKHLPDNRNQHTSLHQDRYTKQGNDDNTLATGGSVQRKDEVSIRDHVEADRAGGMTAFPGPAILDEELPVFDHLFNPSEAKRTAIEEARNGLHDSETDSLVEDLSTWLSSQFAPIDTGSIPGPAPIAENVPESSLCDADRNPALRIAESIMQTSGAALSENRLPSLTPDAVLSTISIKLFGCTPSELPSDLREHMTAWFSGRVAGMEGYLRPGCLHLLVEAIVGMSSDEGEGPAHQTDEARLKDGSPAISVCLPKSANSIAAIVNNVLARKESFWHQKRFIIQAGAGMALVENGILKQIWNLDPKLEDAAHEVPVISRVYPRVLLANQAAPSRVVIEGYNLMQNDCEILCRLHGSYLSVGRASCLDCTCSASVSACCKPLAVNKEGSCVGWEKRCCGCCVSKLASLSLADNGASSVCGSGKSASINDKIASLGVQSVEILLPTNIKAGLLHIDAAKQLCISPSGGKVLVVSNVSIYNELLALALRAPEVADALVSKLGIILDWTADPEKVSYAFVENIASKLVYDALIAGLPAIASEIFDLIQAEIVKTLEMMCRSSLHSNLFNGISYLHETSCLCFQATIHRISSLGERDNIGLLHCAVQSQKLEVLDLVLSWAQRAGKPWACDVAGPCGITPLHLAVLCTDASVASKMILKLLVECPSNGNAWKGAKDGDGLSPADYALHFGRNAMLEVFGRTTESYSLYRQVGEKNDMSLLRLESQVKVNEAALMDSGPQTPGRCKCQEGCPCARNRQPCASCFSSDEEEICCGKETGKCGCCANLTLPNETSKIKQVAKCCKS